MGWGNSTGSLRLSGATQGAETGSIESMWAEGCWGGLELGLPVGEEGVTENMAWAKRAVGMPNDPRSSWETSQPMRCWQHPPNPKSWPG